LKWAGEADTFEVFVDGDYEVQTGPPLGSGP
jgi:hypothetical protein